MASAYEKPVKAVVKEVDDFIRKYRKMKEKDQLVERNRYLGSGLFGAIDQTKHLASSPGLPPEERVGAAALAGEAAALQGVLSYVPDLTADPNARRAICLVQTLASAREFKLHDPADCWHVYVGAIAEHNLAPLFTGVQPGVAEKKRGWFR